MADILVIKLGALGDFIQALGVLRAIRAHHAKDRITLLTTQPYADLARRSSYVDDVWIDVRPKWHQAGAWMALSKKLNGRAFARVYDLQNNDRTALYLRLFKKKPEWVGAARGASHRNDSSERTRGTAFEGHKQTLALAGIHDIAPDPMTWMAADVTRFGLRAPYALIVPGASPTRPLKRWPARNFAALCQYLIDQDHQPVLIGGKSDQTIADEIAASAPRVLNLIGQTDLFDIPALARGAALAIGNDTGPMHLIAPTGCRTLVLYSRDSDPVKHRPLGQNVITMQENNLNDLAPAQVIDFLKLQKILI